MKFSFVDNIINTSSFLELCNFVQGYGFDGVEIFDAKKEKENHADSVFRSSVTVDAKRKLINRRISIPVLSYPMEISEDSDVKPIEEYLENVAVAGADGLVVKIGKYSSVENLSKVLKPIVEKAEDENVNLLIETIGKLANTENLVDLISLLGSASVKVCWNIRETFFTAKESADKTIQTLGAYIGYVRLGDKKGDENCLIGDGELPVKDFINALRSLNYEGFVSVMDSSIKSVDILLTHFKSYLQTNDTEKVKEEIHYNRDKTGTFPWKRYDVLDVTFSEVLDKMVEKYPDQYAFKYTTLDYTRTYFEH